MAALPDTRSAPRRAAVYVRVSTPGQEAEGTSLGTQEDASRASCLAHGWTVAPEHVYVEVHSGAHLWERPQLTRLRQAMRAGAFDVLVCYAIDRLSREQDHLGLLVSEAQHYGCTFAFVTEDWDTSPLGKFLRGATAFAAELERAKILERTACVINEPEAQIVRRIFAEIAGGETLHGMAAKLTREGVPISWPTTRNRCNWAHGTIRNICQTPAYWGQPSAYRWQTRTHQERDPRTGAMRTFTSPVERATGEQIPLSTAVIPALVDPRRAQQVAERLAYNRAHVRRPATHHDALLAGGYGVCGLCGGSLLVKRGRRGAAAQVRYHCRRKNDANAYPCQCHTMTVAALDGAVWARVARVLRHPEIIRGEIERRQSPDTTAADLAAIDERLADIAGEQQTAAYAITKLPNQRAAEPLVAQLTRLDAERDRLEADRQGVLSRAATWQANRARLTSIEQRCAQVADRLDTLTLSERRDALYALGITVALYPKDRKPRWEIVGEIDLDALGAEADADGADAQGVIGTMMVRFIPGCTRHRIW